jgi:hypothetical protein
MPYWISPHFRDDHFPVGPSLDDKVAIFADRVRGWQLDIADRLQRDVQHSGFAVLSVVVSYFEMIAKYRDGFVGTGKSEHYFTQGVEWVFPAIGPHGQVLKRLYKAVRCGMYHSGITLHGVGITDEGDAALRSTQDGQNIMINPHQLVPALQDHFSRYVVTLQNALNEAERLNFQKRFDRGV